MPGVALLSRTAAWDLHNAKAMSQLWGASWRALEKLYAEGTLAGVGVEHFSHAEWRSYASQIALVEDPLVVAPVNDPPPEPEVHARIPDEEPTTKPRQQKFEL